MSPGSAPPHHGGLLTIAEGPIHAELLPEVGARLHRLRAFGHDLLRTPDDPAEHVRDPFGFGGYVMAPWCNRIAAGRTAVDRHVVNLASNFPDGSAIHGQVYATPWQQRADGTLSVRGGGDGWPWPYEATLRVTIDDADLSIDLTLTNLSETPMPAGIGLHPWFRRPLDVGLDAELVLRSVTDATAMFEPVAGPWDLRVQRLMPHDLDAAWLVAGDPAVRLRWPQLGVSAELRARSDAGLYIVAASPSSLDAVAVEPQTHAPHGLQRFLDGGPGALQLLAPGATIDLHVELAFARS